MFLFGVLQVVKDIGEWIFENSHSLIKTYAVFTKVAGCFLWIPREFHAQSISHFHIGRARCVRVFRISATVAVCFINAWMSVSVPLAWSLARQVTFLGGFAFRAEMLFQSKLFPNFRGGIRRLPLASFSPFRQKLHKFLVLRGALDFLGKIVAVANVKSLPVGDGGQYVALTVRRFQNHISAARFFEQGAQCLLLAGNDHRFHMNLQCNRVLCNFPLLRVSNEFLFYLRPVMQIGGIEIGVVRPD